jgi:hypothetical protein
MDPGVGRFASSDPFAGRSSDAITLHKYLYAGLNPVSNVDPSGEEFSLVGLTQAMAIGAVMGAITTPLVLHALNKPITVRDVFVGAAMGAVFAGVAFMSAVAAGGLLVTGLIGSGALVYRVFTDPGSTWSQKVAASALLLAAVIGSGYALRVATRAWSAPQAVQQAADPQITIGQYRLLHQLGVDKLAAFFRSHGLKVAEEVYVRNPFYSVGRRYDLVVRTANGEYMGIEYKGTLAAFNKPIGSQAVADGWIRTHGGVMFGSSADAQ